MKPTVTIHKPTLNTNLPAHEHAARARRQAALKLPNVPTLRPPTRLKPAPRPRRKTFGYPQG